MYLVCYLYMNVDNADEGQSSTHMLLLDVRQRPAEVGCNTSADLTIGSCLCGWYCGAGDDRSANTALTLFVA